MNKELYETALNKIERGGTKNDVLRWLNDLARGGRITWKEAAEVMVQINKEVQE